MTGPATDRELLVRRLGLVGEIARLNAEALKHMQSRAGFEMEVLRLELDLKKDAGGSQLAQDLQRELQEVRESADAAAAQQAECAERVEAIEQEMEALDRRLAPSSRGKGGA